MPTIPYTNASYYAPLICEKPTLKTSVAKLIATEANSTRWRRRCSHSSQQAESFLSRQRVSPLASPRTQRYLDLHPQTRIFAVSASLVCSPLEIRGVLERVFFSWPLILHSSQKIATRRTAITNSKNCCPMIILPRAAVAKVIANTLLLTNLLRRSLAPAFGICNKPHGPDSAYSWGTDLSLSP